MCPDKIVSKFPQIDKLWVLTGEGQNVRRSRVAGRHHTLL